MDFLGSSYISNVLHTISSDLLVPVVLVLLVFLVYSVYAIGLVIVELVTERKQYRVYVPEFLAELDAAEPTELDQVIDASGLLRNQKDDLLELANYLYLPTEARTEVARRLLANQDNKYQKVLGHTDIAAKVAPMLGLMGTLIPLGPGIVALGTGDTATLSDALLMAFDTTVAGLATAVVCFIVSRVRRRWYSDYLVSMESAMNTLLEKADILHAEGFEFSPAMFKYDARGKKATKVALDGAGERQRAGRGDVARGGASGRRGAGDVAPSLDDAQAAAE